MATEFKNLSSYDPDSIPSGKGKRVAIVVSEAMPRNFYSCFPRKKCMIGH